MLLTVDFVELVGKTGTVLSFTKYFYSLPFYLENELPEGVAEYFFDRNVKEMSVLYIIDT